MRLLILIDGLGAGGAERSTAEMLPALADAGITPVVVCLNHRPEGVESSVIDAGFDVRFIDSTSFFGRVRSLRRILGQVRPDVLHTVHFDSDLVGRVAAIASKTVVMSSFVNTSYDKVRLRDPRVRGWKLAIAKVIDAWSARFLSDHFHAVSGAVKNTAVDALGVSASRVTVVERGRNEERLGEPSDERRRAARLELGIAESDEVVLNVARQEFQKGQQDLLEAAAALIGKRPNLHVLIAGRTGNATEDLQRTAERLAVGNRVRFLGHCENVPELLAAADVFVFPSLYEGLGGALLEAMAMQVPIVASDIPALREVLEDGRGGLLTPPESPDDLSKAIERLLDQPGVARDYADAAHDIFRTRFTLERSLASMVALYRKLAADQMSAS